MRISKDHRRALLLATVLWWGCCPVFAQTDSAPDSAKTTAAAKPENLGTPDISTEYHDPKTGNITAGPPIEAFIKKQLTPLPPDAPKPSANLRDFAGIWFHDQVGVMRIDFDDDHKPVPLSVKGRMVRDRRVKAGYAGSPYIDASLECLPPSQPWQLELNFPFRVFQSDRYVVFAFEEYHTVWNIRMTDHHHTGGPRQYMGDSIGHWEGDTLVVDTINYKAGFWIDPQGSPASRNSHLIHRIKRIYDPGPKLQITTTVDDKEYYTKPWSFARTFAWRPDRERFAEFNCEPQASSPDGISRYGAVAEPADAE